MNTPKISPEDTRLTTYALGEMDAIERAAFAEQLRADPEAQAIVTSIQETADQLEAVLGAEPLPKVEPLKDRYRASKGTLLSFPKFYYVVGTLAAACFAVLVVIHEPRERTPVTAQKHYQELTLPVAMPVATNEVDDESGGAAEEPAPSLRETHRKREAELQALAPRMVAKDQDFGYLIANPSTETKMAMEVAGTTLGMAGPAVTDQTQRKNSVAAAAHRQMAAKAMASTQIAQQQTVHAMAARNISERQQLMPPSAPDLNTESYSHRADNEFTRVADHPLSTFSVDVDTASYANVRRFLNNGQRPPVDAVRIEELINYFPYNYAPPTGEVPFAASMEVASAPWAPEHRLVRIGLKGREVSHGDRPAANLVFLIDVSGSMRAPNKLPLVKQTLRLLVERLQPEDRVAIVTYAGASGLALPSTPARHATDILQAVDALSPAGSTNGAMGIQLAYDIARANFITGGLNRVILCTDGDFNVGLSDEGGLTRLIEEKAQSGVFLSVLGFGMGNYQDAKLERLADQGNGNYGYIDSRREAEKMLVEQVNGTLVTIAKDVKLQVEFNPAQVASYRLIGYENRMLRKEDFNNDKVDAGEIGAGHTVTALYEIVPVGIEFTARGGSVDDLKYQLVSTRDTGSRELLILKIRYKAPEDTESQLLEYPLLDRGAGFAAASADFKFTAAVAGFGMLLRDSKTVDELSWSAVETWARAGVGNDAGGYRNEFLGLITKASALVQ
ncbi:MAG: von Willebrand factor type A domain-containing protein [Cephaloticoccus sp.]|nr:von Willebrand factor type A domain-containing protein [Cephaloticoccus sp.]